MSKYGTIALILACGLVWSLVIFTVTWLMIYFDISAGSRTWLGYIYFGYRISPAGSIIGAIWAFFDASLAAAFLSWIYYRNRG